MEPTNAKEALFWHQLINCPRDAATNAYGHDGSQLIADTTWEKQRQKADPGATTKIGGGHL